MGQHGNTVICQSRLTCVPWQGTYGASSYNEVPVSPYGPAFVYGKKCVTALYSYEATADTELDMSEGDIIQVLKEDDSGWWQGEVDGRIGWFPFNCEFFSSHSADIFVSAAIVRGFSHLPDVAGAGIWGWMFAIRL